MAEIRRLPPRRICSRVAGWGCTRDGAWRSTRSGSRWWLWIPSTGEFVSFTVTPLANGVMDDASRAISTTDVLVAGLTGRNSDGSTNRYRACARQARAAHLTFARRCAVRSEAPANSSIRLQLEGLQTFSASDRRLSNRGASRRNLNQVEQMSLMKVRRG